MFRNIDNRNFSGPPAVIYVVSRTTLSAFSLVSSVSRKRLNGYIEHDNKRGVVFYDKLCSLCAALASNHKRNVEQEA